MARNTKITFTVCVTEEQDGSLWAEVEQLPGCFASGFSLDELKEAVEEAIQLYVPDGIVLGDVTWGEAMPVSKGRSKPKPPPVHRRMLVHA